MRVLAVAGLKAGCHANSRAASITTITFTRCDPSRPQKETQDFRG